MIPTQMDKFKICCLKAEITHHTVEVWYSGIFVGIRIEEHLSIGVNRDVSFDPFPVFPQKLGNSFDLRL